MTIAAVTVNFQTYSLEYTNETEETMYARAKVLINQLAEKQGAPLAGSFTADITSGVKTAIESDRTPVAPQEEAEMTSTSNVTYYVNMNRPGYLPDNSSNDYPTWQDASEAALDLIDYLDSANDFDYDQDQLINAQNNNTPMNIEILMTNIYEPNDQWLVFIAMVDTDNDPKAEEKMMVLESHNLFNGVPGEPRQAPGNAAHLHFDPTYAPCCVLIVRDGCDWKDESNTILVQLESDQEEVARSIGWTGDSEQEWWDFLRDLEGISAPVLMDYFPDDKTRAPGNAYPYPAIDDATRHCGICGTPLLYQDEIDRHSCGSCRYANLPPMSGGSHTEAEILDFILGDKGPGISQETIDAERQADEETITAELIDALRSNDQRKLRRAMDRLTNRFNRANQQRILENANRYANLPPMSGGSQDNEIISTQEARTIASEWHSGQWSALYEFASTGTITDNLYDEIKEEIETQSFTTELENLLAYVNDAIGENSDDESYANLPPMSGGNHEAARGMKQHYHVNAAMPGCLPDNSSMYLTKKDAEKGMQWEKDSWLDAWDGATASGNKRSMYVIDRKLKYGCNIYITLESCTDPNCDIDQD